MLYGCGGIVAQALRGLLPGAGGEDEERCRARSEDGSVAQGAPMSAGHPRKPSEFGTDSEIRGALVRGERAVSGNALAAS